MGTKEDEEFWNEVLCSSKDIYLDKREKGEVAGPPTECKAEVEVSDHSDVLSRGSNGGESRRSRLSKMSRHSVDIGYVKSHVSTRPESVRSYLSTTISHHHEHEHKQKNGVLGESYNYDNSPPHIYNNRSLYAGNQLFPGRKHERRSSHYGTLIGLREREMWNSVKKREFTETNPGNGKFENLVRTMRLERKATNQDVLNASQEVCARIQNTIHKQKKGGYLKKYQLPAIPKRGCCPRIARPIKEERNLSTYKAPNIAHIRTTNGGYIRTCYGGLFMH